MTSVSSSTIMQWEAVGAWQGGTVRDLALDSKGGVVSGLLASSAGVYRWTQADVDLEPLPQGMSDLNVITVAFAKGDSETPATPLAATMTGRLFRGVANADDMGAIHWQEIGSWAGLGMAVALAPSPTFATDQTLFIGTPGGIYRTQDDGQSWESCNFGLLDEHVLCLACAPDFDESEILWAGTAGGGLYRSRNSARAWRESGHGLPDASVQSLAFSPNFAEDHTLFVGMEEHGIYVSRDGGDSWLQLALEEKSVNTLACSQPDLLWAGTEDGLWRVTTGNGAAIQVVSAETVLGVATSAGGQVAAGLLGSGLLFTNDGTGDPQNIIWQRLDDALHAPPVVTCVGTHIFALDLDGVMAHSVNEGASWHEMESADDVVFNVVGALVDAEDGSRKPMLLAPTSTGLVRWNGEQWTWDETANFHFGNGADIVAFSPAYNNDQTLLIGSTVPLFLSQDDGTTWRQITGPWQGHQLLRAHFAPTNSNEIVALTVQPTEADHFAVTIWHTRDQGQSWETLAGLTSAIPAVLMAWPQDNDEHAIFLATQHRVIKLFHQGDPANLQLHQHFFDEKLQVTALSLAPDYPYSNIIWAATTGGLYRSVDRGLNWGLMLDLPLDLPVVWLDVTFTHVNIITLGGRVWRAAL